MNPQALAAAIARARQLDLAASTLQALCILSLSDEGSCSLNHISNELEVTGSAVTGIADRLEDLRYATRSPNFSDRRGITLTITDHGREALADIIRDATVASWKNLTPA